jgi:hypothetical protein
MWNWAMEKEEGSYSNAIQKKLQAMRAHACPLRWFLKHDLMPSGDTNSRSTNFFFLQMTRLRAVPLLLGTSPNKLCHNSIMKTKKSFDLSLVITML